MFELLFASFLFLAPLQDSAPSYKDALNKAKTENVPLVIMITSDSCPWCRHMESGLRSIDMRRTSFFKTKRGSDLFNKLRTGSQVVPQLVVYEKIDGVWRKRVKIGSGEAVELSNFIRRRSE